MTTQNVGDVKACHIDTFHNSLCDIISISDLMSPILPHIVQECWGAEEPILNQDELRKEYLQDILHMGIIMIDNILPHNTHDCWGRGTGNYGLLVQKGREYHEEDYIRYRYQKFHIDGKNDPRKYDTSPCALDPDPCHECRRCGKWSDWH